MKMIYGLSGYANSGKDAIGDVLVRDFGFVRRSVGDVVLDVIKYVDPILFGPDVIESPAWALRGWELSKWLGSGMPYDEVKEQSLNFRPMMQRLGEGLRSAFGEDALIDAVLHDGPDRLVMTSTRYPNEARAIRDAGGQVWRVERPGFGPINDHQTETGMDDWDYDQVIANDGTLDELAVKVHALMGDLLAIS